MWLARGYRRTTQEEELARLYHIPIPKQTDLPISYNIAPSQKVLTIRFNRETQQRSVDLTITLPDQLASPPESCRKTAAKTRFRTNSWPQPEVRNDKIAALQIHPTIR